MQKFIEIKGACVHNLKNIDVRIPKHQLTVITGVSGSGKSSLAFDTLYEEGKRRYLLFSGADFLIQSKATFDSITGLSPTVAVEQRVIRQSNPRSTVGTKTRVSNLLAVLFATQADYDGQMTNGGPLTMEMFLRNSPKGMCVKCLGKGFLKQLDEEKLFADEAQRIIDVCLGVGKRGNTRNLLESFCRVHGLDLTQPLSSLSAEELLFLKYGDNGKSNFIGFVPFILEVTNGFYSSNGRLEFLLKEAGLMQNVTCKKCGGSGLSEHARQATFAGKTIHELEALYLRDLYDVLMPYQEDLNSPLLDELLKKIKCMIDVGLHHLALHRPVPTLSGGEIQRLFLASYIIAGMDSIIFIFDEPTIGLHELEKEKLLVIFRELIENGNTVIAVEHDANFIKEADWVIDLGPDAGVLGGEKIFEGTYKDYLDCERSKIAPLLNEEIFKKKDFRAVNHEKMLTLKNACLHNLKNVSVEIPLGMMVGVAGVSGSGKSSLISETLVPMLDAALGRKVVLDDGLRESVTIEGTEFVDKCVVIDQKPIGRKVTSNPATYTGLLDLIRKLFADTEDAQKMGLGGSYFSINSKGACKFCKGEGEKKYHVGQGNYVGVPCDQCEGTGYQPKVLAVKLKGKSILDVMALSVDEAIEFFGGMSAKIEHKLKILQDVGMGYVCLGQKTPTLSGGESQRIKLANELSMQTRKNHALYVMDEPTTGLSNYDSVRLMSLMQDLVEKGNSMILTEHDPFMLSQCDWLIELGEGGGTDGGEVIAVGTPADLRANPKSIIGRYL